MIERFQAGATTRRNFFAIPVTVALAGVLWIPQVYADTCAGMHITGAFSGTGTVIVLDNSFLNDANKKLIHNNDSLPITAGTIKKATVVTATTCAVTAHGANTFTITLTGAVLTEATVDGATVTPVGAAPLNKVDGITGTLTGVDVSNVQVIPNPVKTPVASQEAANIPYIGDRLEFNADVKGFVDVDSGAAYSEDTHEKCFKISGEDQNFVQGNFLEDIGHWYWFRCYGNGKEGTVTYKLPKSSLAGRDVARHGFTWGLMAVPFKYDFKTKSIEQAGTLGPYLAYGDKEPGISKSWALFAGATQVPVTTTQNNVTTTSNQNGYSVATGPMWTIKENFTVAFFIGWDFLQQNSRKWYGFNFAIKSNS